MVGRLLEACSRTHRSQHVQSNTHWEALDEMYQIDIPLYLSKSKDTTIFGQILGVVVVKLFQTHNDLEPRRPPTNDSVTKAVRGRPNLDWLQELLRKIHRYSGKTRREVYDLAQDRRLFHQFIERLCSLDDQR